MSDDVRKVYAWVQDVQARMLRSLTADEEDICASYLQDAALMIDAVAPEANEAAKKTVSCRMVIRMLGDGSDAGVPLGATQGSMSALGYSQSWTFPSGAGGNGEMYLSKADKMLLGCGRRVGSYSPVQELVRERVPEGCFEEMA